MKTREPSPVAQTETKPATPPAQPFKVGSFDLRDRLKFPLAFSLGCLAVLVLARSFALKIEFTYMLLAAVGGTTAFLYAQHTRDIQLFRELFHEFNERYSTLDGALNEILNRPEGQLLNTKDKELLISYFNLCAEEYMYAAVGYIDSRVWDAWHGGMCYFDKDPEIHEFWKDELQQASYYGFTLSPIPRRARNWLHLCRG
jgi:hypothetical protein